MVIHQCNNCNKIFNAPSKLERHKNNKTPCNKLKEELKCHICNITFIRPTHKQIHEKTKKHIEATNKINNYNDLNKISETQDTINNLEKENIELKSELCNFQFQVNNLNNIIDNLNNIINNLELENLELKSQNKLHTQLEYIYIIHPIQCINMNIYKIGRTNNIISRHKQYPKGSELLFTIPCKNSKVIEQEILTYLKTNSNYQQIKKYGIEYFRCNINILINDIQKLVNNDY